ncbi:MAG: hypothetical protein GTO45_41560 [Candidatus Aminicenantes bacterium]|nr:hypothetical protein [Candidatus Aminicenantes bacterium]NIM85100.1 hypothetical protein [Candidatus Aminicenantes bacterium]NIN24607.1 hypothetical protein [Candidatus Aminicenantes bacterium]NIN48371.1 hypothetical protein [Candidatus Aminicenantes bacterium]NIN91274.1 hypothetical protein [Candidatus Aminicenantes bacterium]
MEKENELDLLKKLHRGTFSEAELIDIFYQNRDRYRILLSLVQQPRFPEKHALNIISKLFPMDLIRVIKNKRTTPAIRKRAEMEFVNKYNKYPLGEKLSYMKTAPNSLLEYFIEEKDKQVLSAILNNPYCTEELVLKFVNRTSERFALYEVLADTEWYKRLQVAYAVSLDASAPIKMMVLIIPYLNVRQLERLYNDENTHQIVKNNIIQYMEQRRKTQS